MATLFSQNCLEELKFSKQICEQSRLLRIWLKHNDSFNFSNISEADRLQLHIDLENILPALILYFPEEIKIDWLARWRSKNDVLFHPKAPLNGHELQKKFDISAGVLLGDLIRHLCHEQAFGRLKNREDAFQAARSWLNHKKALM